jgi:serine protease AprX
MKNNFALYFAMLFFVSCMSSSKVNTSPTSQQKKATQKQQLNDRLQTTMAELNQRIDSLIAAQDSRLRKDKNGNYIRPNWISNSGKPMYYRAYKRSARKAIKADALSMGGTLGLNLNGEGIHIGIWDDGHVFAAHDEFAGDNALFENQVPIEIGDSDTATISNSHPTAVASIVMAKGVLDNANYDITGIAPQLAQLYSYDWERDLLEIFLQLQTNNNTDFILSNHSYGIPIRDENNEQILTNEEIGSYSSWSSLVDEILFAYPNYVHVVAGGNDGGISYPDQSVIHLDQLTGASTSKNALTVGSFSMDNNSENFTPTNFSSAGPTNDFRIKPEICAAGQGLGAAAWDESNPEATDTYIVESGTSFSAPGATAAVALLQQLYRQTHNTFMQGATVKALLCHTADDITTWNTRNENSQPVTVDITGPDVKTGYGAINLEKAAAIIQKDVEETNTIVTFSLDQNDTETFYFQGLDAGTLTATLSWYDPHEAENATSTLVNDLDIRIYKEDTTFFPWKLPTDAQQAVAVLGDNSADNLEQIKISDDFDGVYQIEVSHKATLQDNSQDASLIISGPGQLVSSRELFEKIRGDGFLVAPIPADDSFTITVIKKNIRFRNVHLFNLHGSEVAHVKKASFSRNRVRFDVANLAAGSYILVIETDNGNISKNVVIR